MSAPWRLLGLPAGLIIGLAVGEVWTGLIAAVAITALLVVVGQMLEDRKP